MINGDRTKQTKRQGENVKHIPDERARNCCVANCDGSRDVAVIYAAISTLEREVICVVKNKKIGVLKITETLKSRHVFFPVLKPIFSPIVTVKISVNYFLFQFIIQSVFDVYLYYLIITI